MLFGDHIWELYTTAALVVISVLWNISNAFLTIQHLWETSGCQTVSLIIFSISISNVLMEFSMFGVVASVSAGMFCLTKVHPFLKAVIAIWIQSNCVSFWSIAWLSIFYCIKIIRVSGDLLGKLKRNISSLVNAALLLTALGSFAMSVPLYLLQMPQLNGTSDNEIWNVSCFIRLPIFPAWVSVNIYTFILIFVLCPIPLLIMLPTSLRLVVHLYQHTLAMRKNENQFQGADTYLLVCKLTVSLVAVYFTTLAIVSLFFFDHMSSSSIGYGIIVFGCSFYSMATGVLLTVSNSFMKKKLRALICW